MHIMHVVPSLNPHYGGPSRSVPQLCEALHSEGVQITLLTTHKSSDASHKMYEHPYIKSISYTYQRPEAFLSVVKTIYQYKKTCQIIHIHSLWNSVSTSAAQTARILNIPYIITPRGMLDPYCLKKNRFFKKLYAKTIDCGILEHAEAFHCLNNDEADALIEHWNIPSHKIFIAANGIDFQKHHTQHRSTQHFPHLAYLGRLHPIKNIELQLDAIALLKKDCPHILLSLIGPDDGSLKNLQKKAADLQLEKHVVFYGPMHTEKRLEVLASCHALLQTSHYECHSVSVNEALSMGIPCIITHSVHYSDIHKKKAGYVVENSPQALAQSIQNLAQQPEHAFNNMKKAARNYAHTELAWPKIAQHISTCYKNILEGKKKGGNNKKLFPP